MIGRLLSATRNALNPMIADRDYVGALLSGYTQMAVNVVVQLGMVPLYLETMGRVSFGLLMVLLALATYIAVGALWLTGGTTRTLGEKAAEEDFSGFAAAWAAGRSSALIYAGAVGGLALAIVFAFPDLLGKEIRAIPNLWLALILFALNLVTSWLLAIDRVGLNVTRQQTWSNALAIGGQLVFISLAVPLLLSGAGLVGVTGGLLAGNFVALLATRYLWRRLGRTLNWFSDFAEQKKYINALFSRRGGAFTLYGVLSLSLQADILIVGFVGGPLLAADFVLVWKIAEVFVIALGRVPDALQPRMIHLDVRGEGDELARTLSRTSHIVLLAAAVFALAYSFGGHAIVEIWVGANNVPDSPYAFYLAGGAALWLSLAKLPTAAAFVTVRLRPIIIIMACELAAKLAMILALIGTVGFLAPLVAINLVHILGCAWAYRWLQNRMTQA